MMKLPASLVSLVIAALFTCVTPAFAQNAEKTEKIIKMVKQADGNGDGKITKEELSSYRASIFTKLDLNGDKVVNEADKPRLPALRAKYEEVYEKVVPTFDRNDSGSMTLAEWNKQAVDIFALLDSNNNNSIDATEILSVAAKAK